MNDPLEQNVFSGTAFVFDPDERIKHLIGKKPLKKGRNFSEGQ